MFEVVVRRIRGTEWVASTGHDMAAAVNERRAVVANYKRRGFVGRRNAAGVYRLSSRINGQRVRLAVYIRQTTNTFSLN